ncbi:MAG: hypothetical protein M5R36_25115 [Deltaproteobacteria bacterium]|nr:hypothetical protein [Deltaproteobacteria bacterium]
MLCANFGPGGLGEAPEGAELLVLFPYWNKNLQQLSIGKTTFWLKKSAGASDETSNA